MNRTIWLIVISVAIIATGCSLAPKYTRPDLPVSEEWHQNAEVSKAKESTDIAAEKQIKWREFFTDKKLTKVIETALDNNRDLKLAALNVERAQIAFGIQKREIFPAVNASGSYTKQRIPADLSSSGTAITVENSSLMVGISSWELDFWGRLRSLKDKALEEYLATQQARDSAQIVLISAVANAYLQLAADREALKLAKSTLETQKEVYDLIQSRYRSGLVSELDLYQVLAQVASAEGEVGYYTQLEAQDINALNLIVGTPSFLPDELLPNDFREIEPFNDISIGLPSDVLLHRPDILAQEHKLKAANASIGAARAAFFPYITLSGATGTASAELSNLLKSGQSAWNFSPQIVLPIFDLRIKPAYQLTKVEKEIALTNYEKAIQTAFKEVADALAVKQTMDMRLQAQKSLLDAVTKTYRFSQARYNKGIDSYLGVLDAQRSLYAAEKGLIPICLMKIANQVRLYAVVGGGVE